MPRRTRTETSVAQVTADDGSQQMVSQEHESEIPDDLNPQHEDYLGLKADEDLTDDERERLHRALHPQWYSDSEALSAQNAEAVSEAEHQKTDADPDPDSPTE